MKIQIQYWFLIALLIGIAIQTFSQSKEDRKIEKLFNKDHVSGVELEIVDTARTFNIEIPIKILLKTNKKQISLIGPIILNHFDFILNGAILTNDGRIKVDNADILDNHALEIVAISKFNSTIKDNCIIVFDYKGTLEIDFSGENGENGKNGKDGKKAPLGKPSEVGGKGFDGNHGKNGNNIDVYIDLINDNYLNQKLLNIKIIKTNTGEGFTYLADPDSSQIIIKSCGGIGGNGGSGGIGGDGFDITRGTGWGGYGGMGGNGGNGGDGGNAGNITIFINQAAKKYLNLFKFINRGGKPGEGGNSGERGIEGQSMYMGQVAAHAERISAVNPEKGLSGHPGQDGNEPVISLYED